MNSLLLLVPLSLLLVVVAGWAFAWAVRRGQFDDLDTPALDILVDDTLVDGTARLAPAAPEPIDAGIAANDTDLPAVDGDA